MQTVVNVLEMPLVMNIINLAEHKIKRLTGVEVKLLGEGIKHNSIFTKKEALIRLTEKEFEKSWAVIISKNRKGDNVKARDYYTWVCVKVLQQTYEQTGQELGGRDHTTILAAIKRCKRWIKDGKPEAQRLMAFIEKFKNNF